MANLKNTTINDTGFLELPRGTTAQRPGSPSAGDMRYNTETDFIEWFNGDVWITPEIFTDFSEYTLNSEPNDWTRIASPSNFRVIVDNSAVGGVCLQRVPQVNSPDSATVLKWDGKDRFNVDIIASIRNANPNGNNRAWNGIIARGSLINSNLSGYMAEISRQGGTPRFIFSKIINDNLSENIRPDTRNYNLHIETVSGWSSSNWYYLRIQAIGSEIKTKYWLNSVNEPSNWNYTFTDSSPLPLGFLGAIVPGNLRSDLDARWDEFKILL